MRRLALEYLTIGCFITEREIISAIREANLPIKDSSADIIVVDEWIYDAVNMHYNTAYASLTLSEYLVKLYGRRDLQSSNK